MTTLNQLRPLGRRKKVRASILELIKIRKKQIADLESLYITPQKDWLAHAYLVLKHREDIECLFRRGVVLTEYMQRAVHGAWPKGKKVKT